MRKSFGAAAMTVAFGAAILGAAGPAHAQDEWVMPDLRGVVLQNAIDAVQSVVGGADLKYSFVPRHVNQVVYNYSNWAVCSTSPSREKNISQKSKKVAFSLRRLNEKC